MQDLPRRQAYYEANRPSLDRLVNLFESALNVSPDRVLLYKDAATDFSFVEGERQADECNEPLEGEDEEFLTPAERAADQNRGLVSQANTVLGFMSSLLENEFAYEHAVWRGVGAYGEDPTKHGLVVALDLFDTSQTISCYRMHCTEREVTDRLMLLTQAGEVKYVRGGIRPARDELVDKCREMFGPYSKAFDLLTGQYERPVDLDSSLTAIRAATLSSGVYPKEEVDAILQGIKKSYFEAEVGNTFAQAHDLQLPTAEALGKFTVILESLSE